MFSFDVHVSFDGHVYILLLDDELEMNQDAIHYHLIIFHIDKTKMN